jgi:small ligand-binding sensory domain FIST
LKLVHAHAAHADWKTATEQAARSLRTQAQAIGLAPTLGFVYFTDPFVTFASEILTWLKMHTGVTEWVGSVGVGVCATGVEFLDEPAIVLMAGDFVPGSFSVFSGKAPPPAGSKKAFFGIVHADPQTPDIDELIADMSGKVQSGYLCGGLSSSRSSTVQIANHVFSGGLSGVVFDQRVPIATRLTQGVAPASARRYEVTRGEGNYVVELDDRPALDVMLEDFGITTEGLRKAARDLYVGLVVRGSEGALGAGDYLVRNLIGIDPHNKIIAISDHVETGQRLLFCRRNQQSARDDLVRMIYDLKDDLSEPPKGALYHACVGRGPHMFGEQHAELKLLREHLGDIPLIGFFANGEIARDKLYGYTGVLTVFR